MCGGIACQTNMGDGEYPVYVTLDKGGQPTKLEVDLTFKYMEGKL